MGIHSGGCLVKRTPYAVLLIVLVLAGCGQSKQDAACGVSYDPAYEVWSGKPSESPYFFAVWQCVEGQLGVAAEEPTVHVISSSIWLDALGESRPGACSYNCGVYVMAAAIKQRAGASLPAHEFLHWMTHLDNESLEDPKYGRIEYFCSHATVTWD
jgi:hypothetical protein